MRCSSYENGSKRTALSWTKLAPGPRAGAAPQDRTAAVTDLPRITDATPLHDRWIRLRFSDGVVQEVDLTPLLAEGQLFAILFDTVGQTPIFVIWNGVPLSKASFLDGIVMAAALNAARTPSAYPIVMERIGDLTGDRAADDATCAELFARDPLASEGSVSEELRHHLVRDIGPRAAAEGLGDMFLLSPLTATLSRGETIGGRLQG